MNRPLFALLGVFVLVGAAVGPAVAATTQAGNDTENSAGNAPVEDGTFGQQVSAYVQSLLGSNNSTGIGPSISSFVVANNPGNAPAFAGGPGGPNATENDTAGGPPAFVQAFFGGNATDGDHRGPPAHAGGPDDGNETAADGNRTAGGDRGPSGDERGPPEGAGPGNGQGPGGPGADER